MSVAPTTAAHMAAHWDMATVNLGIENLFDRTFEPNYSTSRYREDAGRFVYVRFDRRF